MAVTIHFFGWYYNQSNGKNNDKIWGWIEINDVLYNFWGRRPKEGDDGKHLTFKIHNARWGEDYLHRLSYAKIKKGYIEISNVHTGEVYPEIDNIYPNFISHMKNKLMYARLADKVRGQEEINDG